MLLIILIKIPDENDPKIRINMNFEVDMEKMEQ